MKGNVIICIGRQLGSGGREVAHIISQKMGISFYDKEIIEIAARQSGISAEMFEKADEKPSDKFMGGFMNTQGYIDNNSLFLIQSETIRALAAKGSSVFVGRCADYILRDYPHLLSVFITADIADRVSRLCSLFSIDEEKAKEMIKVTDKKRAEYYNFYTFKEWGAASSYNVCLSTSGVGVDVIADRIIEMSTHKGNK